MSEKPGVDIKVSIEDIKSFLQETELHRVQNEFFNRLVTILIAALGLVTALAWDDVLRELFAQYLSTESSIMQRLYYAVTITFIATFLSLVLGKFFLRRGKKNK